MGNSLGGKRRANVMKIDGTTFKLKTPVRAGSVVANHPGHVVLESEAVKHYGGRAKPLEPQEELKPKRLYFLVQLPTVTEDKGVRRVRSQIHTSAKDRLESLMLARRSASDLWTRKPPVEEGISSGGAMRVKIRLPKAELENLMAGGAVAEKIIKLCAASTAEQNGNAGVVIRQSDKSREKRVGFLGMNEEEIGIAMSTY